jgi:thymidylate synthase ThyX
MIIEFKSLALKIIQRKILAMEEQFDIKKLFKKEDVLDNGYIELIDGMVTHPMLKVINSARVSFKKETKELTERDSKLIKFLIDHEHFSTLRHSYFSFRVKAPISVFRQWWKYQIGSDWLENENVGSIEIPNTSWNEMCLTGDTNVYSEIKQNNKRCLTKYNLEKLNILWKNGKKEEVKSLFVRSLDEDTNTIILNKIKDVIERGEQDVYEITLNSGKVLNCTKSHRIFTSLGWKTMDESLGLIEKNNLIAFNKNVKWATNDERIIQPNSFPRHRHRGALTLRPKFEKVIGVKYLGKRQCFDLEMEGKNKNFVANGIIVHNSGRYVEFEPEFYIPEIIRIQSKDNKQGSHGKLEKLENGQDPVLFFKQSCVSQYENYKTLVNAGAAKEQARMLLPQNLYSECIWTCSLQTILFFLHQRLKEDAQWEIREYAKAVQALVSPMLIDNIVK